MGTSFFVSSRGYKTEGKRQRRSRKEVKVMKHSLKISVSRQPQNGGIVTCRNVTVRERILRFLLGNKQRVTILVPGDSVQELAICEIDEGGEKNHEQNQVTA